LGKAIFTIVGAIAELERNIIIERIKGGLRRAKEQGKRVGRRPLIDSKLLETMTAMRGQGKSFGEIARAVKLSKSLVHKPAEKRHHKSLKTGTSLRSSCPVIKQMLCEHSSFLFR
jgi:DNA invertase Pin-like site-specific DNA recombinase